MIYVLYNPQAGNNQGFEKSTGLESIYKAQKLEFLNIAEISDYNTFFNEKIKEDDSVIIAGGDGTLNRFIK